MGEERLTNLVLIHMHTDVLIEISHKQLKALLLNIHVQVN